MERCSVVVSLDNSGSWYPVCNAETSGKRLPVLDLAICDYHAEVFDLRPSSVVIDSVTDDVFMLDGMGWMAEEAEAEHD